MNLGRPVLGATYPGADPLEVPEGAIVRLTGPNGSGKTTILRALAGLPTHVGVQPAIRGENPQKWAASRLAQRVAYVPQHARDRLVGLTVAGEARLRGLHRDDSRDVSRLSTGEASRVALDLLEAPIWLLDEPASHLDEAGVGQLRRQMTAHSGTILYTDHTNRIGLGTDHALAPTPEVAFTWPPATGPAHLQMPAQSHRIDLPDLSFPDGIHVLTGDNGSGKTTALRILAGLEGTAQLAGRPMEPGMAPYLGPDPWPYLVADSVGDLVGPGPLVPASWLPRHPWTLSTGEAQRVALASILERPGPLLLDEPEAHLDGAALQRLADILSNRPGVTVIASHDPIIIRAGNEVRL